MNLSGNIGFKEIYSVDDVTWDSVFAEDRGRKKIYVGSGRPIFEGSNPTEDNTPIIYKTNYDLTYDPLEDVYTLPTGYAADYNSEECYLTEDNNHILINVRILDEFIGASTVNGWRNYIAKVTINHDSFTGSTTSFIDLNHGGGPGVTQYLYEIDNEVYVVKGSDPRDINNLYPVTIVDYIASTVSSTTFSVPEVNYYSKTKISDTEYVYGTGFRDSSLMYKHALIKIDTENKTYATSSNIIEGRGLSYIREVGDDLYEFVYTNRDDDTLNISYTDFNLNVISNIKSEPNTVFETGGGGFNTMLKINNLFYLSNFSGNVSAFIAEQKDITKPIFSGDLTLSIKSSVNIGALNSGRHLAVDTNKGFAYIFSGEMQSGVGTQSCILRRYDLDLNIIESITLTDIRAAEQHNRPFFDFERNKLICFQYAQDSYTGETTTFNRSYRFFEVALDSGSYSDLGRATPSAPLESDSDLYTIVSYDFDNQLCYYQKGETNVSSTYLKRDFDLDTITSSTIATVNGDTYPIYFDRKDLVYYHSLDNSYSGTRVNMLATFDYSTMTLVGTSSNTWISGRSLRPARLDYFTNTFNPNAFKNIYYTPSPTSLSTFYSDMNLNTGGLTASYNSPSLIGSNYPTVDSRENYYLLGSSYRNVLTFEETQQTNNRARVQKNDNLELFRIDADNIKTDITNRISRIKNLSPQGNDLIQPDYNRRLRYVENPASPINLPVISTDIGFREFMSCSIDLFKFTKPNNSFWILFLIKNDTNNQVRLFTDREIPADRAQFIVGLFFDQVLLTIKRGYGYEFNPSISVNPPGGITDFHFYAVRFEPYTEGELYICNTDGTLFGYTASFSDSGNPYLGYKLFSDDTTGYAYELRELQIIDTSDLTYSEEITEVNSRMNDMASGTGFTWSNIT